MNLITGLSIGFLGSFHCIGMCGPIALILPVQSESAAQKYSRIFYYNTGRAVTYSSLGAIFGFLGTQFRMWGMQQTASIIAGAIILLFIFSGFSFSSRIKLITGINLRIQHSLGKLLKSPKNQFSFFSIGLLNGLLPCGLVYVGIAAALATTHIVQGAFLMLAFGLGTFPVMAGMMVFGHLISIPFRQKLKKAVPLFVGMLAVILILRGMNLGIPFISPKMDQHSASVELCHNPS